MNLIRSSPMLWMWNAHHEKDPSDSLTIHLGQFTVGEAFQEDFGTHGGILLA